MYNQKQEIYRNAVIKFKQSREKVLSRYLKQIIYDEHFTVSLVQNMPEYRQKNLLKDIYETCKKAGASLKTASEKKWTTDEIIELLLYTDIPSVIGNWRLNKTNNARILFQKQCLCKSNKIKAKYWEKAINGFIAGLSNSIHYVMTCNEDTSQHYCIQTIFNSEFFGKQWQKLPDDTGKTLKSLTRSLKYLDINLIFDGYYEGLLFYHVETYGISMIDQTKDKLLVNTFLKVAKLRSPNIRFIKVIK